MDNKNLWETDPKSCQSLHYKNQAKELPYKLSLLSKLKVLVLNTKNLEAIPEWFTELESLESLTLISPQLKDIIVLQSMPKLKHLHIRSIHPKGLNQPYSFNLESLSLMGLGLDKIPLFVSKIKNLENLFLTQNQITDISVLKNCLTLKRLYLTSNQIQSIPDFISCMSLKTASFEDNPIQKKIADLKGL